MGGGHCLDMNMYTRLCMAPIFAFVIFGICKKKVTNSTVLSRSIVYIGGLTVDFDNSLVRGRSITGL